jgi:ClpP class serine protease
MKWFLQREVAARFENWLKLGVRPSAEQFTKYAEARAAKMAARSPECLTIAGDVAQIKVEGVLTAQPDFWARLFYGANTSYAEIRESLGIIAADPLVKRVEFQIDSPGGQVAGLFETLGMIEAFDPAKKRSVRASLAASAAYSIAAVVGSIEATSIASEFGSIGVVQSFYIDETLVEITSTEAPDKRPDPTTPEGQAVIRRELDAIHEIFVDAIARGRTSAGRETTVDEVNAEFGRGAVFLAREAFTRGMIDKAPPKPRSAVKRAEDATNAVPDAAPTKEAETHPMTLEQLKAQHPELFKQVQQDAITTERDRVAGHLTLGESSGDMKTAIEAIKSGAGLTVELTAKYMSAGMRKNAQTDRQQDAATASAALDGASAPAANDSGAPAKDLGDQVVEKLEAQLGKKKPAA